MTQAVENAVTDSYWLLAFCTRERVQVRDADRNTFEGAMRSLVVAQQALERWIRAGRNPAAEILDDNQATEFWKSFVKLSNLAYPATIESIKYYFQGVGSDIGQIDPATGRRRKTRRAEYSATTTVMLFVCIAISLLWFTGRTTLDEYDRDYQHWLALSAAARPNSSLAVVDRKLVVSSADRVTVIVEPDQRRDRLCYALSFLLPSGGPQTAGASGCGTVLGPPPSGEGAPAESSDAASRHAELQKWLGEQITIPCPAAPGSPFRERLCHENMFSASRKNLIFADEFVHNLAELQAERATLGWVVKPFEAPFELLHASRGWPRKLSRWSDCVSTSTLSNVLDHILAGCAAKTPSNNQQAASSRFPEEFGERIMVIAGMLERGMPVPSNLPPPINNLLEMHQKAELVLSVLQNYILPVSFGLLGACVHVLRTIGSRNETFTYTPTTRYRSRLVLGMVAGPAIGWILTTPEGAGASLAVSNVAATPLTANLSRLTLAFVGGYAVEVLFSLLDKIIAVFRDPGSSGSPDPRSRSTAGL